MHECFAHAQLVAHATFKAAVRAKQGVMIECWKLKLYRMFHSPFRVRLGESYTRIWIYVKISVQLAAKVSPLIYFALI